MSTAEYEVIDRETGEIMQGGAMVLHKDSHPAPLSVGQVLDRFANKGALAQQQKLVAAYDEACRALVGPNDVQVEGGREFKKKSAWRKLGRAFGISTEIVREESHYDAEGHLVASVVVRAVSPWGQSAEAIGKCSTRERRFKKDAARQKADHDCPATAQTRATNRAISDLIAAGEVSAEEIEGTDHHEEQSARPAKEPWDKIFPFGKNKGTRMGDMLPTDLESARSWCVGKDAEKFADLISDIDATLLYITPLDEVEPPTYENFTAPELADDPDEGLPF